MMKRIYSIIMMLSLTVQICVSQSKCDNRYQHHDEPDFILQEGMMGWYFSNDDGERIGGYYKEARPFFHGLAAVKDLMGWSFINVKGERVGSYYEEVSDFIEGRALVMDMMGWHFIDKDGRRIGLYYKNAYPYYRGRALVNDMMGWYLINREGKRITEYHDSPEEINQGWRGSHRR